MSLKLTQEEVDGILFFFKEMDKNGDGLLTKAELKWEYNFSLPDLIMFSRECWMKVVDEKPGKLSEKKVETLLAAFDCDGDGKISIKEFALAMMDWFVTNCFINTILIQSIINVNIRKLNGWRKARLISIYSFPNVFIRVATAKKPTTSLTRCLQTRKALLLSFYFISTF